MFLNRIYRENGYTLPFVLMTVVLITTLLFGITSLVFFYNKINLKKINKKRLDLACISAVQLFLKNNNDWEKDNLEYNIDSLDVGIRKKTKGLFCEIVSSARSKDDSSSVKNLLAFKHIPYSENAIVILKDNFRGVVTGNTKITGNILTSTDEITTGKINGIPSADRDYLNGKVDVDRNVKTKLSNEDLIANIFSFKQSFSAKNLGSFTLNQSSKNELTDYDIINISGDLTIEDTIIMKKETKPLIFNVIGKTIFKDDTKSNLDLTVISDSIININNMVELENAVLSAEGEITIGTNSYLKNTQIFSKKGLTIFNSTFDYPTVLLLYVDAGNELNYKNLIDIKSSIINGSIFLVSSVTGISNNKSKIKIDGSSKIQGMIYSENNVEISGIINGMLYTYGFWFYKDPTEYIDWLVNLEVNRNKLDNLFLFPVNFEGNKLEILKETWIY